MAQNNPIIQLPFNHIYGFDIDNADINPSTRLNVFAGQCRDTNNVMDIVLGHLPLDGIITPDPLILDISKKGANGLDDGTPQTNRMYNIYVIADSSYKKPVAALASLNTLSTSAFNSNVPLLPAGYDSYRLIGYWPTGNTPLFVSGYINGNSGLRRFLYDVPPTLLTAGSSTIYSPVFATNKIPSTKNTVGYFRFTLTPNAASDQLQITSVSSLVPSIIVYGQVASIPISQSAFVKTVAGTSGIGIQYRITDASASANIVLLGFEFNV